MTARRMASNLDANGKKILNLPVPTAGSNEAARQVDLEAIRDFAISRTNHSGTQLASTIEDFAAAVRLNRLDQMAAPTTPVSMNSQKITNVATPTASTDAANKSYVDTQITGLTNGQVFKGIVRALVRTNVNTTAPGSTLDGLTPATGQVFWLGGQTTGAQNGPWVWNGAASPMTRPANWDTAGEAVVGSYWLVSEGTDADKFLLMTNDSFVLNTTTAQYKIIDATPAPVLPVEADLGDGSATNFVINHGFGTRAVAVHVYRNASPYDEIDVAVERTTINSVTVAPDEVWATNQFHAVVAKL